MNVIRIDFIRVLPLTRSLYYNIKREAHPFHLPLESTTDDNNLTFAILSRMTPPQSAGGSKRNLTRRLLGTSGQACCVTLFEYNALAS